MGATPGSGTVMVMDTHALPPVIEVAGLTKTYGRRTVVDDVTFAVPIGTVCGLVGPNGAGKTTVMAMLLGLVRPTAGRAKVLGQDVAHPHDFLPRVGSLIESPAFYAGLSGTENLAHLCRLGRHPRAQIPELLELVGLGERGHDRYGSYSLGMKQRLGIAAALIGDPDLVILDEPTNGVDPQGMKDIRGIIREISRYGRTVLVSSHLLGELEAVCDHLVVLDRGGCKYAGSLSSLGDPGEQVLTIASAESAERLAGVLQARGLMAAAAGARRVRVTTGEELSVEVAARVNTAAYEAGIVLTELHHHTQSLEDRVLDLVGQGALS